MTIEQQAIDVLHNKDNINEFVSIVNQAKVKPIAWVDDERNFDTHGTDLMYFGWLMGAGKLTLDQIKAFIG